MSDDYAVVWASDLLDLEQIIKLCEGCDKDCAGCSRTERMDCMLELKESMHSLSLIVKDAVLSFIEALRVGQRHLTDKKEGVI